MDRFVFALACMIFPLVALADVWGTLEPGAFRAGFETLTRIDEFRASVSGPTDQSAAVKISVWYPVGDESPAPVHNLRDYVGAAAESADGRGLTRDARRRAAISLADFPLEGVPDDALQEALSLPTRAVPGATRAAGRFPVLIIVPGNHDPAWRHFVLAEYLASHGYIVAAFPSASRRLRPAMDMNFGHEAFREQLADTAFTVDFLRAEYPYADASRVMLLGFSMGGNTGGYNLLRDRELDGFVCLDCGIGSTWGTPFLRKSMAETFPSAARRPLVFLHISEGGERNDHSFIDSFERAHAYHAIVEGARHFNFTSLGAIAAEVPTIGHERWLASGPFAREVHDDSVESVRLFLDAHLKEDPLARSSMNGTGEPRGVQFNRVVAPK